MILDANGEPVQRATQDKQMHKQEPVASFVEQWVDYGFAMSEKTTLPAGFSLYYDEQNRYWEAFDTELPEGWRVIARAAHYDALCAAVEHYITHLEKNRRRITTRHRIEHRAR